MEPMINFSFQSKDPILLSQNEKQGTSNISVPVAVFIISNIRVSTAPTRIPQSIADGKLE